MSSSGSIELVGNARLIADVADDVRPSALWGTTEWGTVGFGAAFAANDYGRIDLGARSALTSNSSVDYSAAVAITATSTVVAGVSREHHGNISLGVSSSTSTTAVCVRQGTVELTGLATTLSLGAKSQRGESYLQIATHCGVEAVVSRAAASTVLATSHVSGRAVRLAAARVPLGANGDLAAIGDRSLNLALSLTGSSTIAVDPDIEIWVYVPLLATAQIQVGGFRQKGGRVILSCTGNQSVRVVRVLRSRQGLVARSNLVPQPTVTGPYRGSLTLTADLLIAPRTARICPICEVNVADVVGSYFDDESGNELVTYRCTRGDEWVQPSRSQVIWGLAYGTEWRERRRETFARQRGLIR